MTDEKDKAGADSLAAWHRRMARYNMRVVTVVQGPEDFARLKATYPTPADKGEVATKEQAGEDGTKNEGKKFT